jgi:hypothetical protein
MLGLRLGTGDSLGAEDGLPLGVLDSEGGELRDKLGASESVGSGEGLGFGSVESEGEVLGPVLGAALG